MSRKPYQHTVSQNHSYEAVWIHAFMLFRTYHLSVGATEIVKLIFIRSGNGFPIFYWPILARLCNFQPQFPVFAHLQVLMGCAFRVALLHTFVVRFFEVLLPLDQL